MATLRIAIVHRGLIVDSWAEATFTYLTTIELFQVIYGLSAFHVVPLKLELPALPLQFDEMSLHLEVL